MTANTTTGLLFSGSALIVATLGAVWDVRTGRIPNALTYSGILLGLGLHCWWLGWEGLYSSLFGTLIAGGIFWLFYLARGMGAGDVKLMAAVGSMVGPTRSVAIMLGCAIAGGLMAAGYMLYHKRVAATIRNVGELLRFHAAFGAQSHPEINLSSPKAIRMPYGVPIAVGALYSFCATLL